MFISLVALLVCATTPSASGEDGRGPSPILNGRSLVQPPPGEGYRVWLVGHAYGQGVYPVASLLVNRREINATGAVALFMIGDAVQSLTSVHERNLRLMAEQIEMPVFLAPGNHETLEYETYVEKFGSPWYELRIADDVYLVLHLNLDHDTVSPTQLRWFQARAKAALNDKTVRNVVIVSHHLVWAVDDPRLEVVRSRLTWPPDYRSRFFEEALLPMVDAIAERKPVYWISGDRVSFPPFFWRDPRRNVTYLASGIKDHPADSIVEMHSDASGSIQFRLVSLSGLDLGPIEQYGLEFWEAYYSGELRVVNLYDALPLQLLGLADEWMFITNRRFVYGATAASLATATLFLLLMGLLRWRRLRRERA